MLESLRARWHSSFAALNVLVSTYSPLILGVVIALTTFQKLELILSGFGDGTSSFTMMNLLYGVFPSVLHLSLPTIVENQVWLAATAAFFAAA